MKVKKLGILIIAAVLLVAMAFAGVGAADTVIDNLADYNANITTQSSIPAGTYYIKGNDWTIPSSHNITDGLTIGSGKVVLDFTNFTGGFAGIPMTVYGDNNGGLFGNVTLGSNTLEIVGLNMTSVNVTVIGDFIGGIIGYVADSGTLNFTNCHLVNCSITGNRDVGGLVGRANSASVNVEDCSAMHCDVVSINQNVGGLVGTAATANFARGTVTNSTVASTDSENVGGLVGNVSSAASFESCWVENASVYADSIGVGGLVGGTSSANGIWGCEVKNCVIASSSFCVGGLVGGTSSASGIDNCSVKNSTIRGSGFVGGLVGNAASASGWSGNSVENCAVSSASGNTNYVCGDKGELENPANCSVTGTNFIKNNTISDTITAVPSYGWNTTRYVTAQHSVLTVTVTNLGTYGKIGGYGVKSAQLYTVTYDGNGNTSGTVPVDGNGHLANTLVSVLGNTGNLEKTGYVFNGWNTAADGTGTSYAPGATFTITKDTMLYANWTEKPATYVEVDTWAGLNKAVSEWTDTTEARTVAVNASIADRDGNNTEGINVYGKIILTTTEYPAGNEAIINGDGQGRLFTIQTGGNLTLEKNATGTATLNLTGGNTSTLITMNEGGAIYARAGNFTINDGVKITNCSAYSGGAVYVNSGYTFTMNGGSITDCMATVSYGGGVNTEGAFTMNGGSISNCSADYYGGGVCSSGVFIMNNGTIINCTADMYGGGVEIDTGVFTMNNGTIARCSSYFGGGVDQGGTFTMNGGYITDCEASYGGGIYVGSDEALISGGTIEGNNAYVAGSGIYCNDETLVINGTAVVAENNDVALVYDDGDCYPIEMGDTSAYPFTGHIDNITIYDYYTDEEIPSAYLGKSVVVNGSAFSSAFKLRDSSVYSSYQLTTSGNDLILSKKLTYTPSSSSKQTGSTQILQEGQAVPTAYATAAPTAAPTAKPTEKPATPTVVATEKPTTQPTQQSPAPVVGILAGLGAAALVLRLRR